MQSLVSTTKTTKKDGPERGRVKYMYFEKKK